MIINHNITALNTHRQLSNANNAQANSMEKLSSGLRINKASDDAAGLSISEKMRGQIRGLEQASANAQDGISLMQTAEGALNETHDILQRMRELSVQAANDTNTDEDRGQLQKEVDELAKEITRIANQTEFNGKTLLDGSRNSEGAFTDAGSLSFQIGSNTGQTMTLDIAAMDAVSLGVNDTTVTTDVIAADVDNAAITTKGINISVATEAVTDGPPAMTAGQNASAAIDTIDAAIEKVSDERSKLGANQNRLDHTINNLNTSSENLTAAESRIRDVDYAEAA